MIIKITSELCYFLGLIAGRGSFEKKKKIIVLEFDYAKPLEGIPYCPTCREIVKGFSKKKCLTHGVVTPIFDVGPYDQQIETEKSITDVVIPIIAKVTNSIPVVSHAKTKNGGKSFVSYELSNEKELCDWIFSIFEPYSHFDSFEIPDLVFNLEKKYLKEFVSGVTDCAAFPKWANFKPYFQNEPKKDRARGYFQFVRNWKIPVQFCRILQDFLSIPVDNIRWGHPNIVDGSLADYDEAGYTAMREHQLKLFPEYFESSFHKFEYKKKIHQELSDHNTRIGFSGRNECDPPKAFRVSANHPLENHPQIPTDIRNEHFDAYWQICWKMGCERCQNISSNNLDYVFLTGKNEDFSGNLEDVKNQYEQKRINKLESARENREIHEPEPARETQSTGISEADTYPILDEWLNGKLTEENQQSEIVTLIVATSTLSNLPTIQHDLELTSLVEKLEIRPDVVGFVDGSKMSFIESKIEPLSLSNLGQLLGYCMIANPDSAFLISTKPISASLTRILSTHKELLEYNGKEIQIGQLDMESKEVTLVD